jgi:outer membrane protein assembly factor BamB
MKTLFLLASFLVPAATLAQNKTSSGVSGTGMFRGNPQHTGVYDSTGVPAFHKIKWKFHTPGFVISSPAIDTSTAYAVNLATGEQKWKFATEARITSSPAIERGTVYFLSYDGKLYAVDASTGKLKWKFQTAGERRFVANHIHGSLPEAETMPDPFDFYLSSPTLSGEAVYFGSGDGNIYSLDAASGKLNWKFTTGNVVHASPAVANRTVYIGSWDSYFYAIDAATGKEKWRFKTGVDPDTHNQEGIQSSAAVADGIVYFGCRDSNFYALDASTGQKKWSFNNKGSWVITSPASTTAKFISPRPTAKNSMPSKPNRRNANFVIEVYLADFFISSCSGGYCLFRQPQRRVDRCRFENFQGGMVF